MDVPWVSLGAALAIRLACLVYGVWHDNNMVVKYTDVDYFVFTDAAKFVTEGVSPYQRATYRYTPVLAWLLTPNIYWQPYFGKLLFVLFDVASGLLIYKITKLTCGKRDAALFCAQLWLFNPLPIVVSTRGNAESIMSVLVLATLYCILKKDVYALFGFILYGLSVHMKIYPVTYALPIYLILDENYIGSGLKSAGKKKKGTKNRFGKLFNVDIWPNRLRLTYILFAGATFLLLTGLCCLWYGDQFLQETYLYHVTRRDIRHNFSVYFYMLYLSAEMAYSQLLGLLVFLPQLLLLLAVSFCYHDNLIFSCFIHTTIFVTFNKVCTSQYFLWYLCLLPLVLPFLKVDAKKTLTMIVIWFLGQATWLVPTYYLEFEGRNTFLHIWLMGLGFFAINVGVVYHIIKGYYPAPLFKDGHRVTIRPRCRLDLGYIKKKKVPTATLR